MRPIILKLFLLAAFVVLTFYANAQAQVQSCNGSLGDPVVNEDFGSGAGTGNPLPYSETTLMYDASGCPTQEGSYSIISSLTPYQNCRRESWFSILQDHTGNANGRMMIINASEQPSIFFTQKASGLCPNTTYEFSAYILNLIMKSIVGVTGAPVFSEPNITFSIETTTGQILATYNTGVIQPTEDPTWVKYGVYFTTPANATDVVVKMTNLAEGGVGNDLVLDDIAFRACGPLIEAGFNSINGPVTEQICVGSPTAYTIQANVVTNNTPLYQWQLNRDSTVWTDIPGATGSSLSVNPDNAVPARHQYRLGVTNGSTAASCRVYSFPLTIQINPIPVVPPIPTQTVCAGTFLVITASGGDTYSWSGPGMPPSTRNPLVINSATLANSGTYTVVVTSAGCSATTQAIVNVLPSVTPGISDNAVICGGTSAQLTASGGVTYKWKPSTGLDHDDIANPLATPLQTTTYRVYISNGGCTDSSKSVTVKVIQPPVANGGGNRTVYQGDPITLKGTAKGDEISSILWSPATGLSDPTSLTPTASPTDNITYTLTVTSQNCGFSTDMVFVRVYKKIAVPNVFSPNNDRVNDTWNIGELATYPDASVMVFSRYGQRVYQGTGSSSPWDGTSNGSPLPPGTYYYIIDLKDNAPKVAGWVLLVK